MVDKIDPVTRRSLANLAYININVAKDANVYEVITADKVIINKEGLSELIKRLK